jgi:transposase-like protein
MANKYSAEERAEALKLADEIGAAAAARRFHAKMQSYTWHRFWIAMTAPFGVSKWILTCEPNFA